MGSCWKQKTKDYLWSIIGETCGGEGCYSDIVQEMDDIHYYNYPKNGAANSCAILCDNSVLHGCTDPSYDEDPDCAKWTALQAMYEPQNGSNAGAGCVQKIGYFKKAGAWYTNPSDFCELDEIFFADPKYVSSDNPYGVYHTGMIVGWGEYIEELHTSDAFTVIEGNTNGGVVAYKYYRYDDSRILGAGRPNWDGWSPDESSNDDEKPEPTPEPTPTPEPSDETVTVELPILYKGVDAEGEVLTIQALLNGFGFRDNDGNMLAVDGIFGSKTEQAVKSYQSARGLEVCGIVNEETWNRILK